MAYRILIVDDNVDAAESLGMLLKIHGNSVRVAHDGEAALSAAAEFLPQILLLDIGLPKLNGFEVAQQIQKEPWGHAMVLIALTGWGQVEDRRHSREAGFDHHLVKPVNYSELVKILENLR